MIRVVLDTNVVVSAHVYPAGLQHRVLALGLHGQVQLYVSPALLAEYERVLKEPRLNFPKPELRSFHAQMRRAAKVVKPMRLLAQCSDDDDNRILECADAARAEFLVTGNKRHFPAHWKQTNIVNGREFLELVFPRLARVKN